MAAPWDRYRQQGTSTPVNPVIAPPDPYKTAAAQRAQSGEVRAVQDQALAEEAAARAAEKAERDRLTWLATHNPDGTPKPTPAELKPIPPAAVTSIQENRHNLDMLSQALSTLQTRPNSVGPGTGFLGDTFTQFNDPEGTEVRRAIGQIGAVKIHDLSGAAVSATEAPRFMPFVPAVTDRPEVARQKLEGFKRELEAYLREQEGFYNNPGNGYLPYQGPEQAVQPDGTPAPAATPPAFSVQSPYGAARPFVNAQGQIAGNVHDNGDQRPQEIASGDTRREDDPLLAGVRQEYVRRLARGDSADELVAWARSAGIHPTAETSIRAQANFRREHPEIAISEYDTSQMDDRSVAISEREQGAARAADNAVGAFTVGVADAGTMGTLDNIVGLTGGNAEQARIGMGQIAERHAPSYFTGQIAGATALNLGGEAGLARLGMGAGALRTGAANALLGAGTGAGTSDYGNRLLGAAGGATINALAGVGGHAVMGLGQGVVAPVGRAAVRTAGADADVAVNQVGRALAEDNVTARQAGQMITEAQGRGSPMSLADVGENTRELFASVGRHRGQSRTIARTVTRNRQEQQLERISSAVRRDLGPTANIREMGEELMARARDEADPLYREAFEAPGAGAVAPKLSRLLARPSVKRAMVRAQRIAQEEGRDPSALGFDLDAEGNVTLTRAPSWETLHYIKTGLDDVIEGYRDTTTGKLVLDAEGRLINATQRQLIKIIDGANPAYAAARGAYAGPASMRDALELGRGALSRSPDDVAANIQNLTPSEMEMYRLGLRKAIVDMLGGKGDYADKVRALIGTPKSRAVLTRVLGGRDGYDRFIRTLEDEQRLGATYQAVHGNSFTAGRMAFDETTSGENISRQVVDAADAARQGGLTGLAAHGVSRIVEAGRLGAGPAGDRARAEIAALLAETDETQLREIARQTQRALAKKRLSVRKASNRTVRAGTVGAAIAGAASQGTGPDR